ncbi:putative olfactory receptor 14L1 [Tachyglossus aculeatus]|uniref:putative olfactory receptor 14L1 n=1 Tax=Tachyglossus aculeatus TaxID=9261 RepID=UPI0018F29EF0|nr:putative olfactory receptor 14L1 [Tachyglossus aculeatus]
MGNLLIIAVITYDRHLHTPMYLFLKNLSFIDLCYISVTVPKSILNGLTGSVSISLLGCVLQVYWVTFLACAELLLLTAMSYDRYIAICCPLHYDSIINRGASVKMVAVSWLGGSFNGFVHTTATCTLPFCGFNVIHQFFCEIPQLLKLSSSRRNVPELAVTMVSAVFVLLSFIAVIISYVHIFSAVMKISSAEGQSKAFSTCLPHLVVFTTFLITCVFEYLKPTSDSPSILDVLLSVFYIVNLVGFSDFKLVRISRDWSVGQSVLKQLLVTIRKRSSKKPLM